LSKLDPEDHGNCRLVAGNAIADRRFGAIIIRNPLVRFTIAE
jgi:hypothetical protein